MESNVDYTNFFEDVVGLLVGNESNLLKAKELIAESEFVKKPTKKVLLGRIDSIFAEMKAIADKLGSLGKVK